MRQMDLSGISRDFDLSSANTIDAVLSRIEENEVVVLSTY